jgi:hypothetical protein
MMSSRYERAALGAMVCIALGGLAGCASSPRMATTTTPQPAQTTSTVSTSSTMTTTTTTAAGEWRDLTALSAWRGYKSPTVPEGWRAEGGLVTKDKPVEDLVSRDQYGDFEFEFDWRIAPGGNAGVFYHATEEGEKVYWTGPEYQLLDDARHPDGKNRLTSAGAAYGLYAPPEGVVHQAGEWNTTRIVARGAHVEHWLNGQKVVEYELWSPDWEAKVKASKFDAWKGYGRAHRGYIGIQGDHTGELSLRNLRIRELK